MQNQEILNRLRRLVESHPDLKQEMSLLRKQILELCHENEVLTAEKDRYRSYVEDAGNTIAEFDLDSRIIYTNKNWIKQLGHTPQSVMKEDFFERLFHPDDLTKALEYLDKAIQSKTTQTGFEYRIIYSQGEYRWHTATLSPILDSNNEVKSILAIAHSVHKRKLAELHLREQEALHHLLLDTMQEAVIMVDNNDVIQYLNPYCCKLFGLDAKGSIGKIGYETLILKEDQHKIKQANIDRQKGKSSEYEVRGVKADSKIIWLKVNGAPIHDAEGNVTGSVGIITDITASRKALQDLKRSEEHYRLIFENSVAGVFQSTMDDRYLRINKAFAHMFGYDDPQTMIREVKDIKNLYVDPRDRIRLKNLLIDQGEVENFECEVRKKNGEAFWISMYARLNVNSAGDTVLEGINVDISESKTLREQLLSSQKMDAIGKLAGGIAHDFNNLLTVILGYSEDILDELSESDPLYEPAEEIVKAGIQAADLTRQLLAFSRKQLIHRYDLDCNSLINNLKSIILRLVGEEVALNLHLAEDLMSVKADPGQMEQMLINLVLNSRDAMPKGGVLKISTQNIMIKNGKSSQIGDLHPGQYVQISVADTGIGMDKETQSKALEPFYTTKPDAKGLGLSSSWGIIRQFGGFINLYSEPGQGSTIKILIPVLQEDHDKKIVSLPKEKRSGQYIMVVENDKALCKLVKRMIENLGYRVHAFTNAKMALRKISDGDHPELLLTDVVMPEMDGKELADAVLKIRPSQKILFMSGFTDDIIAKHGIVEESTPLIQKPFSAKDIGPAIRSILSGRKDQIKVLILDDDINLGRLLKRACGKEGYLADSATDLQEAIAKMRSTNYDLILVDINLGDIQGRDALKLIRKAGYSMPAILLSGMIRDSDTENLEELGIIGVVEKSFDHRPLLDLIAQSTKEE